MIKLILKANIWYDNIKEPKRTLFFFLLIMPIIVVSQYVLTRYLGDKVGYITWASLMLLIVSFRMLPSLHEIFSGKNSDDKK